MGTRFGCQNIITDGLIFHVDAYNTKSYSGTGTNANDLTINGNNGTLINGVGFDGKSWTFDGVNDYITFPSSSSIDFTKTENYSVSVWVLLGNDNPATNVQVLGKWDGGNPFPYMIRWRDNTERIAFPVYDGTNQVNLPSIISPPKTEWINITAVYDWVGGKGHTYLNNTFIGTQSSLTIPGTISNSNNLTLGAKSAGSFQFEGNISNVKIYNRALSASEVKQNYNSTKWRFQ